MYKGVGKMWVIQLWLLVARLTVPRFLMVPRTDMEKELKDQEKDLSDDISGLNKKAGGQYLWVCIRLIFIPDKISREAVQRCSSSDSGYRELSGLCMPCLQKLIFL